MYRHFYSNETAHFIQCALYIVYLTRGVFCGSIQPNMAQSINGCRGLKCVMINGYALFKWEIIETYRKSTNDF